MDVLKEYLAEAIAQAGSREIGILGYGAFGAVTYCALEAIGAVPCCFFDMDSSRIGGVYFGKAVRPLWDFLATDDCFIIDVFNDSSVMSRFAEEYGLVESTHYSSLHGLFSYRKCVIIDPLLVYNRVDDTMGFTFFGDVKDWVPSTLKIVAMGGSTSDVTFGGMQSWPELLHKELCNRSIKNVVCAGGMVGYTSAQERDKFLRDVLPMKPDIVITLSGDNDIGWSHTDPAHNHYSSYMLDQLVRPVYSHCLATNERIGYGLNRRMSDAERWYWNQATIGSVAEEFGIDFLCMLQPCILSDKYCMSDFEASWMRILSNAWFDEHNTIRNLLSYYPAFHEEAARLMASNDCFVDASDCCDAQSGVYIDGIHCSEDGNQMIAKRATAEILRRIER